MGPNRKQNTVLQHFECSNVTKICNRMMFDFYPGLPYMQMEFQICMNFLFSVQPEFGWESLDAICKPTVLVLIESVSLFPDLPSGSSSNYE